MPAKSRSKSFRATLERSGEGLNWVHIRLPFDGAAFWGKRGQIKVKGEINGFAFRTSLFPDGKGGHTLLVNKMMQKCGGAAPGKEAKFRLEQDTEERIVNVPPELKRALAEDKALVKFYASQNYSVRRWIADLVAQARQTETRRRRAEEVAERLMLVMESEHEMPPVLRAAVAGNPRAHAGWERLPRSQKFGHLFAIFSYKHPESRARRVAQAVETMEKYGAKAGRKR